MPDAVTKDTLEIDGAAGSVNCVKVIAGEQFVPSLLLQAATVTVFLESAFRPDTVIEVATCETAVAPLTDKL